MHLLSKASSFACNWGIGELTDLCFPVCWADGGWLLLAPFYKRMHIGPLSLVVNGLLILCSEFGGTLTDV